MPDQKNPPVKQKFSREQFSTRQQVFMADARLSAKRKQFAADGKESNIVTLTGYPILWNQDSVDRGGYVVRIAPGAVTFTAPVMALLDHDSGAIAASTLNGTLKIGQADQTGVPVEIDIDLSNCTQAGRDAATLVGGKFIQGMSFSMVNGFEDYEETKQGDTYIITVTKFTCDEVSIVARPAFATASVAVADASAGQQQSAAPMRIAASMKMMAAALHIRSRRA